MIFDLFAASSTPGVHPSDESNPLAWGVPPTYARIPVTEDSAITSGAVHGGIRLVSETSSKMPLKIYKRRGRLGADERHDHDAAHIVAVEADVETPAHIWREQLIAQAIVWGRHAGEIERDRFGMAQKIHPLDPARVRLVRHSETEQLLLEVRGSSSAPDLLPMRDVFYLPGFAVSGVNGVGLVQVARQAIALSLATEKFGAQFFGQYARPIGFLKFKGNPPKDKAAEAALVRKQFEDNYSGDNTHRVGVQFSDVEWVSLGVPPEEAQFLETRKFQVLEVARFLRVPPHMLYDLERATFSNIEHQGLEFLQYSLQPWLVRIESEIHRKLLGADPEWFARHNVNALLRGTTKERMESYHLGLSDGMYSINEVRDMDDLNPIGPEGDVHRFPLNQSSVKGAAAGVNQERVDEAAADAMRQAFAYRLEQQVHLLQRLASEHLPHGVQRFLVAAARYHDQSRPELRRALEVVIAPWRAVSKQAHLDLAALVDSWIAFNTRRLAAAADSRTPAQSVVDELGTWHLRPAEILEGAIAV